MKTSNFPSEPATPSKEKKDYGNLLCAVMFFSLMVTSLLSHGWMDATAWGCMGTGFALMSRSPGIDGKNWFTFSAVTASLLVLAGVFLISLRVLATLIARH